MAVGLLIVCQTAFCQVYAQNKIIHLKTGNTLEYTQFEIDGDFLNLTVANSSMRIPKSSLSEESLKEFFPNDPLLQPKPETPKEQGQAVWKSYRDIKPSGTNTANQTAHSEPPKTAAPKPMATAPADLSPLEKALARAGENRPELEKALAQSNTPEMRRLIAFAPPYDLVNITAEHLLNTVDYYFKAKAGMPWVGNKPDSGMEEKLWTEYVLPYRIADEDLDDWRKEFYETLSPLVANSKNTKEAVLVALSGSIKAIQGEQPS